MNSDMPQMAMMMMLVFLLMDIFMGIKITCGDGLLF
jgi:hypothetical protein